MHDGPYNEIPPQPSAPPAPAPPAPVPSAPVPPPRQGWSLAYPEAPSAPTSAVPVPMPMPMPVPVYPGTYPPVPWPVPAVSPPKRRVGLGVFIAVTVVVAIVSCGIGVVGGLVIRPARTTGAAAASSSSQPPPTFAAIGPGDGPALLAKILPLPSGARDIGVSGSTNGVMTVEQFVQKEFDGDATELARFKDRGFSVAAQRNWAGSDGIEVHIQLIAFGSIVGAEGYVLEQKDIFTNDATVTGNFSLPVPHGSGFEKSALDHDGVRRMILLGQDGPVAVFIYLFTPAAFDRTAATDLMKRQYVAIAAHP